MFRKAFSLKSNTNLKNSARRKLLATLRTSSDIIPSKSQAAQVILKCANEENATVYTFDKIPYFFSLGDGQLYPTVYFAWISPDSYPVLTVLEQVFKMLENGASLMLPGIIHKVGHFPEFPKNAPVCISVMSTDGCIKGPVAVGTALMSSADMIASGMRGCGVKLLHLYKDYLWDFGPRSHPPVKESLEHSGSLPLADEDFPPLGAVAVNKNDVKENVHDDDKKTAATSGTAIVSQRYCEDKDRLVETVKVASNQSVEDILTDELSSNLTIVDDAQETSEQLLLRCFLAALKCRVKKDGLPLDIGEFYLKYLLPTVPAGKRVDMKKTKYKKFSAFLEEVNKQTADVPIVLIDGKRKGSETITEINYAHPLLKSFKRTDEVIEDVQSNTANTPVTSVQEFYAVTQPVVSLFRCVREVSKGDLLSVQEVRQLITSYIKLKDLKKNGGKVSLEDEILESLVKHDESSIKWDVLFQKILGKMTKTYVVTTLDGSVLTYKLKLPLLTFKVETRSGNKKVTLLNNTAAFGIQPKSLCQKIQVNFATSASLVIDAPQCEGPQIVMQGNQVWQVSKILMEDYRIDKKFIAGLELAPKKKK